MAKNVLETFNNVLQNVKGIFVNIQTCMVLLLKFREFS